MDEPIIVVEYDQRWPRLFDQEQRRIRRALGDAVVDIKHFGSTAVPGLAAKLLNRLCRILETDFRERLPSRYLVVTALFRSRRCVDSPGGRVNDLEEDR